jgi:hypothetical protein
VPITDFFGSVRNVELTERAFNLTRKTASGGDAAACVSEACAGKDAKPKFYHYAPMLPILDAFSNQ